MKRLTAHNFFKINCFALLCQKKYGHIAYCAFQGKSVRIDFLQNKCWKTAYHFQWLLTFSLASLLPSWKGCVKKRDCHLPISYVKQSLCALQGPIRSGYMKFLNYANKERAKWIQANYLYELIFTRNGKIVRKHRPYCWYFCLILKYLRWPYRAYIKTAKNGDFC